MRCALFTICQDEPFFLPIWSEHYAKHVAPDDIYVLNHKLQTGLSCWLDQRSVEWSNLLGLLQTEKKFHVIDLENDKSFDHNWLRSTVMDFQRDLLLRYDVVIFTEIDEILVPHPLCFSGNLSDYANSMKDDVVVCQGYEIVQKIEEENDLDLNVRPILFQRSYWYDSEFYSKPLISRVALDWHHGFHCSDQTRGFIPRKDLILLHLHKVDFKKCVERNISIKMRSLAYDGMGYQNLYDETQLKDWWYKNIDNVSGSAKLSLIPNEIKKII